MAEKKKDPPVQLVSPNGARVTVAESKVERRLAAGYTRPAKKATTASNK